MMKETKQEFDQGDDMSDRSEQDKRLDYLLKEFCGDYIRTNSLQTGDSDTIKEFKSVQTYCSTDEKRRLLRSLMNIRMPGELPEHVLAVQDEYLKERAKEKGIVKTDDISVIRDGLSIWQGDITRLAADAIVNAANSQMLGCFIPMHTCIDNCIHTYAGVQLRAECERQMEELREKYGADYEQPTAVPMLTDAYNLPAKKVIHIVGPIVNYIVTPELEDELAACYRNTLDICLENDLRSVAFCCISTGVFHFPNRRAAQIAVRTVEDWLAEHPESEVRIIFNVFKDEDRRYYEELIRK